MKNNEDKNYKLKIQSAEQDYAKERRFSIRNILQPVLPLINLGIKFLSKIFPGIFDLTNYEITAYSIVSQRVTKPIRIVHLSDLHNSVFESDNEKFTNDIAGLVPDIILITGDMIIADDHNYSLLTNFLTSLLKKNRSTCLLYFGKP
ncbi:MAG: hypothetical protein IJI14_02790 [Anaerolineaceae bacterium]|nr:hypothetical protein [Anaerolineaceae bacterium]